MASLAGPPIVFMIPYDSSAPTMPPRGCAPELFELGTLTQALGLPWTPLQHRAISLGYVASLPSTLSSSRSLAEHLDPMIADLASGRRILWFDTLARPAGFAARSTVAAASIAGLTRKKDVLDHCISRLRELLRQGESLIALRSSAPYAVAQMSAIAALVMVITGTDQYRLYRDTQGRPVGLLSWAWISTRTVSRLQQDPTAPLHPSEWNEGDQLYFRDLAVSGACIEPLATDLSGGLFPAAPFCWLGLKRAGGERATLTALTSAERIGFAKWFRQRVSESPSP